MSRPQSESPAAKLQRFINAKAVSQGLLTPETEERLDRLIANAADKLLKDKA